ncbi:MAG: MBL fold metallo-hydrolase, partial [Spirochaetales bacterium]
MIIKKYNDKKLSLENDCQLSIFFVGVGSAFSKRHYQTNIIIVKGPDHVMIDCGSKAPQALWELGLSVMDVKNFLITHSHADHIGGLEEVMLMYRYVARKKPVIVINKIFQHFLWDLSLRGGSSYNEEHAGSMLSFSDMWEVILPEWLPGYPRETMEASVGGINLKIFRTKHIPDFPNSWQNSFWSCGLIIDDRVMFTSDTRFDLDLITT